MDKFRAFVRIQSVPYEALDQLLRAYISTGSLPDRLKLAACVWPFLDAPLILRADRPMFAVRQELGSVTSHLIDQFYTMCDVDPNVLDLLDYTDAVVACGLLARILAGDIRSANQTVMDAVRELVG